MTRPARDFWWHLTALAIVVAGLGVFAPLAWRHTRGPGFDVPHAPPASYVPGIGLKESREEKPLPAVRPAEEPQPQIAPLRPLVADQIDLDPSVTETPALPGERSPLVNQELFAEPTEEMRLSAARPTISLPPLTDPRDLAAIQQPLDSPGTAAEPLPDMIPLTRAWPYPAALVEQLRTLAESVPQAAAWSQSVRADLERLTAIDSLADPAVSGLLAGLERLAEEAKPLAASLPDDTSRSRLLRAGYALVRRLMIWDQVHTLAAEGIMDAAPIVDRQEWNRALAWVDALLHDTGAAANWRRYLLIERAREQFDAEDCSPTDQRQLARDMLHRLRSTQLSHEQEQFLKTPPFAALAEQLAARAAQTPDLVALLSAIELYERDDGSASSRALAAEYDVLRWSADAAVRELADTVNAYYRNANVRVALSAEFVNRLMPQQAAQVEPVEDVILGAWVSGQSHTNTKLKLVLIPDDRRWNIGLEALGEVASNTSSTKGPATFFQNGWSIFRARKRLTVDRRGIRLFSAEAEANANNELSDFETNFDGIPLLGGIARAVARNQYDSSQPAAKVEVEGKIIVRATSQLDREVSQKLERAKQDFQAKMVTPLRKLNLEPTAVDMQTTAERLIARYRLASRQQVSAHTPRPQAPGDSVLSVQLHETALNNVLENLRLAGRRVSLEELYREMTNRFNLNPGKPVEIPDDLPEGVFVTFADEDPVRLDFQDGRARLTIRLAELSQGTRNRWTNFMVRGYYGPSADQLDANLEREGIIELIPDPDPIRIGDQVVLRGIFAKVLSRNRKLQVINKQIAEAPELRGEQVTQFVIHDGWIGVALGPRAPGRQAAMHPRLELEREEE
jgi:hypothetical protein